jgi:GTP-binding protein
MTRRPFMAIIAIVGSPNVGKSTLFNRITRSTQALVDDLPGVTRDRNYATVVWDEKSFTVVDTGGFIGKDDSLFDQSIREQIFHALEEADILLFVGDGKTGLYPEDPALFDILRRSSKTLFFAVNKIDSPEQQGHLPDQCCTRVRGWRPSLGYSRINTRDCQPGNR